MNQIQYQLELAAFEQKIALAELEESKAGERVKELRYQRTCFQMEWLKVAARIEQQQSVPEKQGQP